MLVFFDSYRTYHTLRKYVCHLRNLITKNRRYRAATKYTEKSGAMSMRFALSGNAYSKV